MLLVITGLDLITHRLYIILHVIIFAIRQFFGQFIRQLRHLAYIVDGDMEYHILTCKVFYRILLREGQIQVALASDLFPDQVILKSEDKGI